ncbi:right-handed parallel beta-helix repeat-containing protein [Methanosarcina mazei]|uniref:Cell surface protein n=1 Tax=Methanosarcina mazei TaxID=2209 RepID=A0A0F8PLK6_METMZ|nr:NosD domain-containing protein [Methanosarcina mazei]KKH37719.1 cell surface protein [Methanosarcina mazei]KKH53164.1 cell surface protein [Methanosarcina mazei]
MKNIKEKGSQALKITATVFILAVICMSSAASAANLHVDPEAEEGYTTIQAAVDAANAGDTIFVSPGTYVENLKIDKQVRIWSDSRNPENTIVRPSDPAESPVEITGERVTFSGFGVEDSEKAGILLSGATSCFINNNRAQNSKYGILLQDAESNNINGNVITLNEAGLRLESSRSNTIQDNLIAYNYGPGISLEESSRNIFFNNYFKNTENIEENAANADNTWQSTLTVKRNLIRGPYIGGNFWADIEGTGYSETCEDKNSNGICDASYTLNGGGSDNSPLFPKIPSAVTALENKLDAEAYELGMETRGVEVNETENPAGEQTGENGPEGEENKTAETETSENGTPAPGIGFAIMAAGAAYFLKRRK